MASDGGDGGGKHFAVHESASQVKPGDRGLMPEWPAASSVTSNQMADSEVDTTY